MEVTPPLKKKKKNQLIIIHFSLNYIISEQSSQESVVLEGLD